jgi:hypothetical protein
LPIRDAATFGCQCEAAASVWSAVIQRAPRFTSFGSRFWSRNAIGSMFAAWASASIVCSEACRACGAPGARRNVPLKNVL